MAAIERADAAAGRFSWQPAGTNAEVGTGEWVRAHQFVRRSLSRPFGIRAALAIILLYIWIIRIGNLSVSKLSVHVGSVPIFLTDFVLVLLLMALCFANPGRLWWWSSTGGGAGSIGRAIWLLILTSLVYFIAAFDGYGMFALRDLAIFSYSVFFLITYFAISDRQDAAKLLRAFMYAGCVVAILNCFRAATGVQVFPEEGSRVLFGVTLTRIGSGDEAAVIAASFAALLGFVVFEEKRRRLHVLLLATCLAGLGLTTVRSAVVGLALAVSLTLFMASARQRLVVSAVAAVLVALALVGATVPVYELPQTLQSFYLSLESAAGGASDPTTAFRMERWKLRSIFGSAIRFLASDMDASFCRTLSIRCSFRRDSLTGACLTILFCSSWHVWAYPALC